jgi:phosphopantothenoylcysteine decarboxylase/phosphopantothenate--cysteine ligase
MGRAIADAALALGHEVIVVSGPVALDYPAGSRVIPVVTTEEMLEVCLAEFPACDGVIGVAAPCDYRPATSSPHKIRKTGQPLLIELVETPDIVATLGAGKRADQWVVGFALETEDAHFRAITKLQKKCCDLVVLNGPTAIDASENSVEIIGPDGQIVSALAGDKDDVARGIVGVIQRRLVAVSARQSAL